MRYLLKNTDQYVPIGPFLDKTAGLGNEDALTVTNFSGVLVKSTQSGASTHTDFTPSATASADWGMVAIGHGGLYDLKIPDSEINFIGSCMLAVWYDAEALPTWHEFEVVSHLEPMEDANVELASIPTTTSSLRLQQQFNFEYMRNARTETASAESLKKEDGTTELGSRTLGDDGTVFSRGEMNT